VRPSSIHIRIDEVVLDGVPFAGGAAMTDALRSTLAKALRQPANAARLGASRDCDRIDAGEFSLADNDAKALGDALAAAVLSALQMRAPQQRGTPPR
jgi:hypothetical protein